MVSASGTSFGRVGGENPSSKLVADCAVAVGGLIPIASVSGHRYDILYVSLTDLVVEYCLFMNGITDQCAFSFIKEIYSLELLELARWSRVRVRPAVVHVFRSNE